MTARKPDAIVLAPGRAITRGGVRAKQKEPEGLPLGRVPGKAEGIYAGASRIIGEIDEELLGSTAISRRCRGMPAQKNWPGVDKLVLDALASAGPDYGRFRDAEEWLRAFSSRLCAEAEAARAAYRWLGPPELESCLAGTFESRAKSGRTRRGLRRRV